MSELTQADRYLLERIRQGCPDAWAQLVARHQGRLVAFARGRLPDAAEAEDLVQETFVALLKNLASFRDDASLETYLFAILRNKIVDWFRGRRLNVCRLQDVLGDSADGERSTGGIEQVASQDPSTSWYVRQAEIGGLQRAALTAALRDLIDGFKKTKSFRDLQVVEMLFYCQLRNMDVAKIADIAENHVALIKHRCLKQIRQSVERQLPAGDSLTDSFAAPPRQSPDEADAMLNQIWQAQRLSCPKRSTIGAFLLGTLEQPWHDYVAFHLDRLGCHFCRANLADLQREQSEDQPAALRQKIFESTVGFLSRP